MRAEAEAREAERQRELRRLLVVSALVHAVAAAGLVFAPTPRASVALPAVVAVDLVSLPAAAAAQRPAAQPTPAPEPAPRPPPPAPKKVVLPETPTRPPAPKAKPKPKAKPRPRRDPEPPPSEPVEYDDLMAQLRAEAGETRPAAPAPEPAAKGGARGPGVAVSAEVAAWLRRARVHVEKAWVLPPGFRLQPLVTHVRVRLDAQGRVLGEPEVTERSGNPWYDDSVVRAIEKASPLPRPPEAGEWNFRFSPLDLT
ncbi:MAG: energy transducer TonB [Myxococcota bacterium]|nr:energy transducer TonB [Myxococcota bacterium]